MNDKELKALLSLLDDEDPEVLEHVEEKIISYGNAVIPHLEKEWESSLNPHVQRRIEDIIHTLQFDGLREKLAAWYQNSQQDLLEGAWLISTYQYPDLSLESIKRSLEQIYYEVWLEFKTDAHPLDQIKILNSIFFSKLKFGANAKNFHTPGNSMINVVLETKKGNPISLCIIYMLVAQRLKLPVYGVNLPNLFILTYKSKATQFYINVFNRGLIFSKSDIDNYIAQLKLAPTEMFYQPCESPDIIRRVLRNLIVSFEKLGDPYKVEEVKALLDVVGGEEIV